MKTFRIKIYGRGGDGLKYLSKLLVTWLYEKYDFNSMSISTRYDSAVRAGKISVTICLSYDTVDCNPYSDSFDIGIIIGRYDVLDDIEYAFIDKKLSDVVKLDTVTHVKTVDFSCDDNCRYNECVFEKMKEEVKFVFKQNGVLPR
jgi:Pyruvate/2-oxoacid:ferredoxin oxidoreductase gamma subunit